MLPSVIDLLSFLKNHTAPQTNSLLEPDGIPNLIAVSEFASLLSPPHDLPAIPDADKSDVPPETSVPTVSHKATIDENSTHDVDMHSVLALNQNMTGETQMAPKNFTVNTAEPLRVPTNSQNVPPLPQALGIAESVQSVLAQPIASQIKSTGQGKTNEQTVAFIASTLTVTQRARDILVPSGDQYSKTGQLDPHMLRHTGLSIVRDPKMPKVNQAFPENLANSVPFSVRVRPALETTRSNYAKPILTTVSNTVGSIARDASTEMPVHLQPEIMQAHTAEKPLDKSAPPTPIRQIIQSLPDTPPKQSMQYELDLNPKDLGQVKITLRPHDNAISVHVLCDIETTAQLVRRNMDHLIRDLNDLGYSNVDVDLGQSPRQDDRPTHTIRGSGQALLYDPAVPTVDQTAQQAPKYLTHIVDIRI